VGVVEEGSAVDVGYVEEGGGGVADKGEELRARSVN